MQFTKTFTFITMAALAAAAQEFVLLVIRSGSDVQYSSVMNKDGTLRLESGQDATKFILTDDKALYDPASKKYVTVKDNIFIETDSADKSFGSSDEHLTYKDSDFYYSSDRKLTSSGSAGIALRMWEPKQVEDPTSSVKPTSTAQQSTVTTTVKTTATCETCQTTAPSSNKKIQFGVITIRSGSKFQNGPIKKVDSHPHVFSVGGDEGEDVTFTLSPDGTMVTQDGRGVYYDANTGELGNVDPFGQQKASSGFSIKNGALFHDSKDNWKACPSGDEKYSLADNDCTGGTPISLKVVGEKEI